LAERNFFKCYNRWFILLPRGFKELMLKVAGHTVIIGSCRVKTVVNWKQTTMLFCILNP